MTTSIKGQNLRDAIRAGDATSVKRLLEKQKPRFFHLGLAISEGLDIMVRLLIDDGRIPIDERAISLAIDANEPRLLRMLLESTTDRPMNALSRSLRLGHNEVLKVLLDDDAIEIRDADLSIAIEENNVEIVAQLLEFLRPQAMHYNLASKLENDDIIEMLLNVTPIPEETTDREALMTLAVKRQRKDILDKLLPEVTPKKADFMAALEVNNLRILRRLSKAPNARPSAAVLMRAVEVNPKAFALLTSKKVSSERANIIEELARDLAEALGYLHADIDDPVDILRNVVQGMTLDPQVGDFIQDAGQAAAYVLVALRKKKGGAESNKRINRLLIKKEIHSQLEGALSLIRAKFSQIMQGINKDTPESKRITLPVSLERFVKQYIENNGIPEQKDVQDTRPRLDALLEAVETFYQLNVPQGASVLARLRKWAFHLAVAVRLPHIARILYREKARKGRMSKCTRAKRDLQKIRERIEEHPQLQKQFFTTLQQYLSICLKQTQLKRHTARLRKLMTTTPSFEHQPYDIVTQDHENDFFNVGARYSYQFDGWINKILRYHFSRLRRFGLQRKKVGQSGGRSSLSVVSPDLFNIYRMVSDWTSKYRIDTKAAFLSKKVNDQNYQPPAGLFKSNFDRLTDLIVIPGKVKGITIDPLPEISWVDADGTTKRQRIAEHSNFHPSDWKGPEDQMSSASKYNTEFHMLNLQNGYLKYAMMLNGHILSRTRLTRPLAVFRGLKDKTGDIANRYRPGSTVLQRMFWSTSKSVTRAISFASSESSTCIVLVMTLPAGYPFWDMREVSIFPGEKEILLPPVLDNQSVARWKITRQESAKPFPMSDKPCKIMHLRPFDARDDPYMEV